MWSHIFLSGFQYSGWLLPDGIFHRPLRSHFRSRFFLSSHLQGRPRFPDGSWSQKLRLPSMWRSGSGFHLQKHWAQVSAPWSLDPASLQGLPWSLLTCFWQLLKGILQIRIPRHINNRPDNAALHGSRRNSRIFPWWIWYYSRWMCRPIRDRHIRKTWPSLNNGHRRLHPVRPYFYKSFHLAGTVYCAACSMHRRYKSFCLLCNGYTYRNHFRPVP